MSKSWSGYSLLPDVFGGSSSAGTLARGRADYLRASALDWQNDGADWPNRESSRFVSAAATRWHVQIMGGGPSLVLLHGTGASTHSWRGLVPLLAKRFKVIAPDLPGHGFTESVPPQRMSLPAMSAALALLLRELEVSPAIVLGHSAGAAIGARMCLDATIDPALLISVNGALLPLAGLPGRVFSPAARLLAATSILPRLFVWRAADRRAVERLIGSTGSTIDPVGVELYHRLVSNVRHVEGTLDMMANWDLHALERDLCRLECPLALIVGSNDLTISPRYARRICALLPQASVVSLPGLGHLAHEERPAEIAALVERFAQTCRLI